MFFYNNLVSNFDRSFVLTVFMLIYTYYVVTTGMTYIKIVNAIRVYIYQFQKVKIKLYSCNVNIYFNQKCFYNNLVPHVDRGFVLTVCMLIYTY